jgi:hypothetical protein
MPQPCPQFRMNVPIAQCADERNDQEGQIGGDTDDGVGQDLQPDRTTFARRLPKGSSQQQDEGMNTSLILSTSLLRRIKIPIPDLTCLCELSGPLQSTGRWRPHGSGSWSVSSLRWLKIFGLLLITVVSSGVVTLIATELPTTPDNDRCRRHRCTETLTATKSRPNDARPNHAGPIHARPYDAGLATTNLPTINLPTTNLPTTNLPTIPLSDGRDRHSLLLIARGGAPNLHL